MTIQNDKPNDANANAELALLYFLMGIINAGKEGDWPNVVLAVAERRGVEPSETLVRQMVSDFWHSIKEEVDFPFVDDDLGGSDEEVEAFAVERIGPAFQSFWFGNIAEGID